MEDEKVQVKLAGSGPWEYDAPPDLAEGDLVTVPAGFGSPRIGRVVGHGPLPGWETGERVLSRVLLVLP